MVASKIAAFTEEEMSIDPKLGYPKSYSKLCNNTSRSSYYYSNPYSHGPPLCFLPYTLQPQEALRAKDLNQLFPVIDPEAKPSTNPRGYSNLLWKQLDHLGNAGFDPALFRVDPFGNVLYLHADPSSPLAWDIDHWFPCTRGGRTVPSNLRLLQWQVCKRKKNKLEFLVPWWDLQLGFSVNQFLCIFASKNSDFRNKAFSFLFLDGGSEELNALQTVDSHSFPQHLNDMKHQAGLAPAAIVSSQRNSDASALKALDINKSLRQNSPFPGMKKFSPAEDEATIQRFRPCKENEQPESGDFDSNPYLSITRARDSLRPREECSKMEAEMSQLEDEVNESRQNNEAERVALQDMEALLIKRRRRAEKCRRLAEAQASYKSMLEKMIRDAMHQSVVYKEQLRLNQAATSALMARLEAQRAVCDTSESELRRKHNQRDEIEKQTRPCWEEQARKRSRMDYTLLEERNEDCVKGWTPLRKELRVLLYEDQRASKLSFCEEEEEEEGEEGEEDGAQKGRKSEALVLASRRMKNDDEIRTLRFREGSCSKTTTKPKKKIEDDHEKLLNYKLKRLEIRESTGIHEEGNESKSHQNEDDETDERGNHVGKENVERWLQIMLENAKEGSSSPSVDSPEKDPDRAGPSTTETVNRLNQMNPEKEVKYLRLKPLEERRSTSCRERKIFEVKERGGSESCESSSRGFRSMPSSPSVMFGIGKKKPKGVMRDENNEAANLNSVASSGRNKFMWTIKRAVNK